ncbi:MAG: carboxypeptidase-like regulatory domain-containing protein [Gemmatimonadota bacterium]|nr:carboxypeptidase-like regulatory domain-containing protein [Gemmatimonadota bacterium]
MIDLRAKSAAVLMGIAGVLSACRQASGPPDCSDPPRISEFAINVAVRDSLTGLPAARGTTVIARDGAYSDSVTIPAAGFDQLLIGLAFNRIGTYSVTARKDGYVDWVKTGVQVTTGLCGIDGQLITARLRPAPPRN